MKYDPRPKLPWDGSRGGVKDDAGKLQPVKGVLDYFPRAIEAIAELSAFGAIKYSWGGFAEVENGPDRYTEAAFRHRLAICKGEELDPESGLPHEVHEVWSKLAALEMRLREEEQEQE